MNYDEIQVKVIKCVASQLNIDESKVTCDSSIIDDLGADSLDTVELVMWFEEEFGVEISDEEARDGIKTVGHIIDFLDEKVNK